MKSKCQASLSNDYLTKGCLYSSLFIWTPPPIQPWFFHLSLPRDQIVALCRLRSNHYNLNYSLQKEYRGVLWGSSTEYQSRNFLLLSI